MDYLAGFDFFIPAYTWVLEFDNLSIYLLDLFGSGRSIVLPAPEGGLTLTNFL